MTNRWRIAFVTVGIASWAPLSYAQRSPALHRFELSFLIGESYPTIVVEEPGGLRTAPTVRDTGESYRVITQEVTARIWWTRRMSTIVGGGWSTEGRRDFTFPRPSAPPAYPFTAYESQRAVSYHNRWFSVSQAWDLTASGPVVPFVGAGVELRSADRRQDSRFAGYTDPTSTTSSSTDRSGLQLAALATAGIRVLAGRHVSISLDGSLFFAEKEWGVMPGKGAFFANAPETLLGRIAGRWSAGAGVRF